MDLNSDPTHSGVLWGEKSPEGEEVKRRGSSTDIKGSGRPVSDTGDPGGVDRAVDISLLTKLDTHNLRTEETETVIWSSRTLPPPPPNSRQKSVTLDNPPIYRTYSKGFRTSKITPMSRLGSRGARGGTRLVIPRAGRSTNRNDPMYVAKAPPRGGTVVR